MRVENFKEIETEFIKRVQDAVICNAASIDLQNRPRSRVLHPIWEGTTGWVGTHRHSHKSKHLANNPSLSLAYIKDVMKPVYVDCKTEWIDDDETKQRIWDLFKNTPEPVGYDPAETFGKLDENFGVLKLTPWRIELVTFPSPSYEEGVQVWRP